jgi:hypothetical protein
MNKENEMIIGLICSTSAYPMIPEIAGKLRLQGHEPVMPNCFDDPVWDTDTDSMSEADYLAFFKKMYYMSRERTAQLDAVLVLNYPKAKGSQVQMNYIGASTFLEMYEAFMQDKRIYILFGLPDSLLLDEIRGFDPVLLNGDLSRIPSALK